MKTPLKEVSTIEHPAITKANMTGYANALSQPECEGVDFFGSELFPGDDVVIYEGEMALRENLDDRGNLEKFLYHFGFEFKTIG